MCGPPPSLLPQAARRRSEVGARAPNAKKRPRRCRQERSAHPEGVEPTTSGSVDRRSIQLSYGCLGTRYLASRPQVSRAAVRCFSSGPAQSGKIRGFQPLYISAQKSLPAWKTRLFRLRGGTTAQKVARAAAGHDSHALARRFIKKTSGRESIFPRLNSQGSAQMWF